jgi:hypothetical protein
MDLLLEYVVCWCYAKLARRTVDYPEEAGIQRLVQ